MLQSSFRPARDVFAELNRLQSVLDQVFRPLERSSIRALAGAAFPVINVGTTGESVEILALAPGLDPASLQMTADRGLLIIAGRAASATLPEQRDGASVYAQRTLSRVASAAWSACPRMPIRPASRPATATASCASAWPSASRQQPRRIEVQLKETAMSNEVQTTGRYPRLPGRGHRRRARRRAAAGRRLRGRAPRSPCWPTCPACRDQRWCAGSTATPCCSRRPP